MDSRYNVSSLAFLQFRQRLAAINLACEQPVDLQPFEQPKRLVTTYAATYCHR